MKLSPPQQALQHLKQGNFKLGAEWQKAYAICQTAEGTFEYDLVHALAHWIEGEVANRDYWYRRVGVDWKRAETIENEAKAIERRLA
jgi:hypothetical protein